MDFLGCLSAALRSLISTYLSTYLNMPILIDPDRSGEDNSPVPHEMIPAVEAGSVAPSLAPDVQAAESNDGSDGAAYALTVIECIVYGLLALLLLVGLGVTLWHARRGNCEAAIQSYNRMTALVMAILTLGRRR